MSANIVYIAVLVALALVAAFGLARAYRGNRNDG